MDIESLMANPSLRRREFPITTQKVFMAHAAVSPLPYRVSSAIADYVRVASSEGQWEYIYGDIEKETRRYAANLLGAHEDEIAFVSSTSMGLSMVASGLSWEKGDNVVVADGDFPSNIYPWLNLGSRGVQVRFIPRHMDGSVTLEDVRDTIDGNTRLVSLSTVNFVTGFKIDVSAIGEYLHRRGILFCVDAIQSLGAIPIDVRHADFLASSAHKWLLGPVGIGILYVKHANTAKVHPVLAGWKCVENCKDYLSYDLRFPDSARRFEPAGLNVIGIVGLHAALKMLLEVGVENIAQRLVGFGQTLMKSVRAKGYDILSCPDPSCSSGIVSFTLRTDDVTRLRKDLDDAGFVVSLRESLDGKNCIRISPHFYNTEEEIDRFLAQVPEAESNPSFIPHPERRAAAVTGETCR